MDWSVSSLVVYIIGFGFWFFPVIFSLGYYKVICRYNTAGFCLWDFYTRAQPNSHMSL